MRPSLVRSLDLVAAACAPSIASAQKATPIAAVAWLTGRLEMRGTSRLVEQRTAERAGTMLGMGRPVGSRRIELPYRRVSCSAAP